MNWLLLTGLSIVSRSIYGVMTKVLSNRLRVSAYTQATVLPLAAAIVAVVFSPLLGGLHFSFTGVRLIPVIFVVLGQGLGNVVYFASIKKLTNGTAQIAFSSILLFNTVLSLAFLSLHLSAVNIVGLVLLFVAIISVTTGKLEWNKGGVVLMVIAAFLFSIFQLASASISTHVSAIMYLLIAYVGAAVTVFLIKAPTIIHDLRTAPSWKEMAGIPVLTALPSLGNFLFAYYAYRAAPEPAKVAMLLTAQVVLTVLLSYIFLKERQHIWRKVIAAAVVVIAAVFIKS